MKLNDAKREVSTEGFDNGNHVFEIKQSSRAFEILSSNIYSDKILAVVREYGCNALDAHKMVQKADVAFEVHLPNQYEPFFRIRDFGPGLSNEDATVLFTTYFHSTKDNSDDFTGCLGLGSKSAFAYADQFSVTSYFGGKKTFFSAYLNEANIPQITLVSEEDTTEPNGLEISMAVKPDDFSAFKQKAGEIFSRFPVTPIFTGSQPTITKTEYSLIGKNYRVIKDQYTTRGGSSVLQGCVRYPIDLQSFNIPISQLQKAVLQYNLELDFEIGKLNITASRERLNYDKNTQKNILDKADEVIAEIKKDMQDKIANVKNMYEAKCLYANTISSSGIISTIMKDGITYQNVVIKDSGITIDLREEVPLLDATTKLQVVDAFGKPRTMMQSWGLLASYDAYKLSNKNPQQNHSTTWDNYSADWMFDGTNYRVNGSNRRVTVFVIKDMIGKAVGPILKYNFEDKVYRVIVISLDDMKRLPELLKQFEGYPDANIFRLSKLAVPPKVVKPKVAKDAVPTRKFMKLDYVYSNGTISTSEREVDPAEGGYYLMSYSGSIMNEGIDLTCEYKDLTGYGSNKVAFYQMLYNLKEMAVRTRDMKLLDIINNIHIINSSYKEIPLNNKKWVLAYDALKPFVDKMYSTDVDFVKSAMSIAAINPNREDFILGCYMSKAPTKLMKDIVKEFSTLLNLFKTKNILPDFPNQTLMSEMGETSKVTLPYYTTSTSMKSLMLAYKEFLKAVSYYNSLTKGKELPADVKSIIDKTNSTYNHDSMQFEPQVFKVEKVLSKLMVNVEGKHYMSVGTILQLLEEKYKS